MLLGQSGLQSGWEGRLQRRGQGSNTRRGQVVHQSPICSEFAAAQATTLASQPQSRGQGRAFPCGCPPGQCGVSGSTQEAPGCGGRMVLGAAAYRGEGWEKVGQGIVLPSLPPPPSPSCASLGARASQHQGFIFTPQPSENCSFHYACAAGYQFGPAPSQYSWVKRASVSPLELALPNPPLFSLHT